MDKDKALKTAANVLLHRDRSRAMLIKRMKEKGFSDEEAHYAASRLTELGFLDDVRYGKNLLESYSARGYGPHRVKNALREKGLEPDSIAAVMEDYSKDDGKIDEYIKKRLQGQTPDYALRKKISDGLYRRGFSFEDINSALARFFE